MLTNTYSDFLHTLPTADEVEAFRLVPKKLLLMTNTESNGVFKHVYLSYHANCNSDTREHLGIVFSVTDTFVIHS